MGCTVWPVGGDRLVRVAASVSRLSVTGLWCVVWCCGSVTMFFICVDWDDRVRYSDGLMGYSCFLQLFCTPYGGLVMAWLVVGRDQVGGINGSFDTRVGMRDSTRCETGISRGILLDSEER